MNILFINASPETKGNTAALASNLLAGKEYETLALCDYRINFYGQTLPGDQFEEVLAKMEQADVLVIGSPVYWFSFAGSLHTLLDRFHGRVQDGAFQGKKLFFLFQGGGPSKWMLEDGEYAFKYFCKKFGCIYMGMASTPKEATVLGRKL